MRSCLKKEIPPAVILQLTFLWKAIHEVCLTSLSLSHNYSRKFLAIVDEHGIELPNTHVCSTRLCEWCGVIQLPTLTCSSRLRAIKLKSRINRSREGSSSSGNMGTGVERGSHEGQSKKLKNVLVTACLMCKHSRVSVTKAAGGGIGVSTMNSTGIGQGSFSSADTAAIDKHALEQQGIPRINRFKKAAVVSPPSQLEGGKKRKSFSFLTSQGQGVTTNSSGFAAFSKNLSVSSHTATSSATATASGTGTKKLSLLELEKQNKKAKRKANISSAVGGVSLTGPSTSSRTGAFNFGGSKSAGSGSGGLGGLLGLFQSK